jgi:hypothetical protein
MIAAKSKRFLPNMNTTTNTKHRLSSSGSRSLSRQGSIQTAKQVDRNHDTPSCINRWPVKTKNSQSVQKATTASFNNSLTTDSNMNTLNIRKLIFVTLGLLAVVLFAMVLIGAEGLTVAGDFIGFVTALAILALAAMDNARAKRLV